MGKPIAHHWSRLVALAAGCAHLAASLCSFLWPKILFDVLTKNLDGAVKPVPVLATINLLLAIAVLALDWPLPMLAPARAHASFEVRLLALYPTAALAALLLYQGVPAAEGYMLAMLILGWGYARGEVSMGVPS